MKLEDKIYIESYISKIVELYLEQSYNVDKLGNLVFEDKSEVKQNINKVISDSTEKLELTDKEIRDYLIRIYRNKCLNPNFIKEGRELIAILEEINDDKDEKNRLPKSEQSINLQNRENYD